MAKTVLKWVLITIGILAIMVTIALAVPMKLWRTGEVPQPELQHLPPAPDAVKSRRVTAQALYCDVVTIGVGELFP